jgi:hypothetical protein
MLLIQDQEQNLVVSSETGRMWESVSWLHATDGPLSPSPNEQPEASFCFVILSLAKSVGVESRASIAVAKSLRFCFVAYCGRD